MNFGPVLIDAVGWRGLAAGPRRVRVRFVVGDNVNRVYGHVDSLSGTSTVRAVTSTIRTLSNTSDLTYEKTGWLKAGAKAVNGGITAGLAALGTALADGTVTGWEIVGVVGTALAAFFAVYATSNQFDPLDVQANATIIPTVPPQPATTNDLVRDIVPLPRESSDEPG